MISQILPPQAAAVEAFGDAAGAMLFGYTDGVQLFDSDGTAMHAFLLLVTIALVLTAVQQYRRGQRTVPVVALECWPTWC